jgi:ubiquinone/menaquinone biosynthesis C-methylase UbiE
MEPAKSEAIKNAVRANFDDSAGDYDGFEEATGLFSFLTRELVFRSGIQMGMNVVDAGCGTGISTAIVREVVGNGSYITGIDLSPGMLEKARRRVPGARFIEGDAEKLELLFPAGSKDAVLYNACVFLLPDAPASFRGARSILRENGTVAMNFITGTYSDGKEIFKELFPSWTGGGTFPAPRFPCDTSRLQEYLQGAGFRDINGGSTEKDVGLDGVRQFYSVPAQSASLYPKLDTAGRRAAVCKMFDLAQERGVRSASMRWSWIVARK